MLEQTVGAPASQHRGVNKMVKILSIGLIVLSLVHGLIHLMGFLAYWPLATIPDLPYKTSLLGGRLDVGPAGMRIYSLFWLLATLGFVGSAMLLALNRPAWAPLLLAAALLSLVISVLDWGQAWRGALINGFILLALFVVFGFRTAPAPFPLYRASASPVTTQSIPAGLPAPVERFIRYTYGDGVPVYHSAVITGRGTLRFMDVTMPARIRFSHIPTRGYHHYLETTFYGIPVFKVNEHYLDGHTRFELPFGVQENEPELNSAANQGLWAEMVAYPAVWVTDERVRWEGIDDTSARLYIPFGDQEQELVVTFAPDGSSIKRIETMRFKNIGGKQMRWWGEIKPGGYRFGESPVQHWEINWEDESSPWLVAEIEDILFNADLDQYIQQKGS
jgi:hypothetical protein